MKKGLSISFSLFVMLSVFGAEIPASIKARTITEQDWRPLYDSLCREVAKWRTPTHTPELVETFWEPLFYLKPQYYFAEGEALGEVEICKGTWFDAYRGKTVADLVAIGSKNRQDYRKKVLSAKDAARLCCGAHRETGCRRYLAIILVEDDEIARIPGLVPAQPAGLVPQDLEVIVNDRQPSFIVGSTVEVEAREKRHRDVLWAFMESYNLALYERRKAGTSQPEGPAAQPPEGYRP